MASANMGQSDSPTPVAVWRCPRCGYDKVEYEGDDPSKPDPLTSWLCEDVCRGPAYAVNPDEERQLERIPIVLLSKVREISKALTAGDLDSPTARINRARGCIVGIFEQREDTDV